MEERTTEAIAQRKASPGRSSIFTLIDGGFATIEKWLNYGGTVVLMGLMVMTVTQVIRRHLFNAPMPGYLDYMEMMMVVLVFFCLVYCQQQQGHVRMEMFMTRVLKGGRRYHLVEFLHLFIALAGFGVIAVYSTEKAILAYNIHDVTQTIFWPTWPIKTMVAIGSSLLCVRFLLQMVENLTRSVVGVKGPKVITD